MRQKKPVPTVPMKLVPVPVERVWGGLAAGGLFGWKPPEGKRIGEWWLLSFRRDHASTIGDGDFLGIPLPQMVAAHPELLGVDGAASLLIKIIDSAERLSVQVHPDDTLARSMGLDSGKTEFWYFLESSPGAVIYCGLRKGVEPDSFFNLAAKSPAPEAMVDWLEAIPVRAGEGAFIRAGTVHAIGEGVVLLEVQQNSDTTFRIYDWGRPRAVHLDEARRAVLGARQEAGPGKEEPGAVVDCEKFLMRKWHPGHQETLDPPGSIWSALTCLKGRGRLACDGYSSLFTSGDTYFLPAGCPPIAAAQEESALFMYSKPSRAKRENNGK
jgi:mannose-6-phosphate isomerase